MLYYHKSVGHVFNVTHVNNKERDNMINRLILFCLIFIFSVSCTPASNTPTSTPTVTALPTITLSPVPSTTPTITPYPDLQTEGPYLLFGHNKSNFTLMDADGRGREHFQLPNDGYLLAWRNFSFRNAVSPDGKWLAYF